MGAVSVTPDNLGIQREASGSRSRTAASPPRIALVGCGAIAKSLHLPGLAQHSDVLANAVLVDPDVSRARALGSEFGVTQYSQSHQEVVDSVDGAIITVPHHLHFPIAMDFVSRGVSVLCEKPLTETAEQAATLLDTAKRNSAVVAANYTKRLSPNCRRVRDLIQSGSVGELREIEMTWGEVFDWPAASGFYFGKLGSGRGVLLDKGAHALDLICWWLGAKPRVIHCHDDSMGGTEAVSDVRLQLGNCEISLRFSWLSRYDNMFVVRGDRGSIQGAVFDWRVLELTRTGKRPEVINLTDKALSASGLGAPLIANFLDVIAGKEAPIVAGSDVLPSIELIEECYARRETFDMPWYDPYGAAHV